MEPKPLKTFRTEFSIYEQQSSTSDAPLERYARFFLVFAFRCFLVKTLFREIFVNISTKFVDCLFTRCFFVFVFVFGGTPGYRMAAVGRITRRAHRGT